MIAALPNRRLAPSVTLEWGQWGFGADAVPLLWHLQFGIAENADGDLRVRELFIDAVDQPGRCQVDASLLSLIHDTAIQASLWLREGGDPAVMARRLDRRNKSLLALAYGAAAECNAELAGVPA